MRPLTAAGIIGACLALTVGLGGCASQPTPTPTGPAAGSTVTPTARAGCPSTATDTPRLTSLGIVLGNRQNSRRAADGVLACYVDPVSERPSHMVVTVADGRPFAVFDRRMPDLPEGRRLRETRVTLLRGLEAALATPGRSAEADILGAVALTADGLRADTSAPRRIVVDDSLLQTTGAMPLQRGYLTAEPSDVVEELRPYLRATLKDLRGYEIVLLAAGSVRDPQPAVDAQNRARLIGLYRAILTSVGARVVIDPGTVHADPPSGPEPVTVVPLAPPDPPSPPSRPRATTCTQVLTADRVSFVSDSARFFDQAQARRTLEEVARQLRGCPGTVRLTGTTSSAGTAKGRRQVSLARANAVRELLAPALGVPKGAIRTRGLGMKFPGYVLDRRPDGSLDAVKAQRNRLVIIDTIPER